MEELRVRKSTSVDLAERDLRAVVGGRLVTDERFEADDMGSAISDRARERRLRTKRSAETERVAQQLQILTPAVGRIRGS